VRNPGQVPCGEEKTLAIANQVLLVPYAGFNFCGGGRYNDEFTPSTYGISIAKAEPFFRAALQNDLDRITL
jgi:hypothetical protein